MSIYYEVYAKDEYSDNFISTGGYILKAIMR